MGQTKIKKRVLVTGGSGFIGSHVVDSLIDSGHGVINLDIKKPHREDVEFVNGSVLDRKVIKRALRGVSAVYHIAGFSNINYVRDNPVDTIEQNILSTVYLLDECRRSKNIHFIYASSIYAFERKGHLYTTSKAGSERIIEDYHHLYGLPYTILRYATVYGPRNRKADVVYLFVKNAITKGLIEIYGGGNQKRNFTHVRDIAEGSIVVIGRKECLSRTVVVASPVSISINELANRVKHIVNPKCIIEHCEIERTLDYDGEIDFLSESFEVLDWSPKISIEQGIKEMRGLV